MELIINGCCNWCSKSIRKENKYFCNSSCRAKHRNKYNNPSKNKIGKFTKFHTRIRYMIDGITKRKLKNRNHLQEILSNEYTKDEIEKYNLLEIVENYQDNKWNGKNLNTLTIEHIIPIKVLYEIFDMTAEIITSPENITFLPMKANLKGQSKFNYKDKKDFQNIINVLDSIKKEVIEKYES
jgi:hypothetical protein